MIAVEYKYFPKGSVADTYGLYETNILHETCFSLLLPHQ